MKNVFVSFWAMACAIAQAGSSHGAPGGETEPSPCLTDALMQISANPTHVAYGQYSVVNRSVSLPAGCSTVHASLNGESAGLNGGRSGAPAATSTYLLMSQTRLGVYGERTALTEVRVTFPSRVIIDPATASPMMVLPGPRSLPTPSRPFNSATSISI